MGTLSDTRLAIWRGATDGGERAREIVAVERAARSYADAIVKEGTVRTLLEGAQPSPKAMPAGPWTFAILPDAQLLAQLSERARSIVLHGSCVIDFADATRPPPEVDVDVAIPAELVEDAPIILDTPRAALRATARVVPELPAWSR